MDDIPSRAPVADTAYPARSPTQTSAPTRPNWRTLIGVLIVAALAALVAYGLSRMTGDAGSGRGRRPSTTVGVAKASTGELPIQLDALGTVTAANTVTVTPRIAGTLTRIAFQEGQMVRAGQLLAQVDERPYAIALQQAEAQLARDQATLDNARVLLQRDQTLLAQDSIARQDVDSQAATVKQSEAAVKGDQAAIAAARLNIVYCRITAPLAGRVGLRLIDVGNYVTAGSGAGGGGANATPAPSGGIVTITQVDPIFVTFTIPESQVQEVLQRSHSGAALPVQALDRSGGQVLAEGTLATLDNQIDVTTGTVKAKARFANPGGALFPNQFVNVRILVDTLKDALIVPASAVRHGSQGDFVWVLQPNKTAHMQPIKLGPAQGEQASITDGLQPGQTVITEGGDRLREGAPVALPGQRGGFKGGQAGGRKGGRRHRGGGQGGGGGGQGGGGGGA